MDNKQSCADYLACVQQNKECYGFIPVSSLRLYTGDPTYYQNIRDIIQLHKIVSCSGLPNYLGCRIPVQSQLNIANWHLNLTEYWDKQLVEFLEFGFPLDFDRKTTLKSIEINHKSADQFKDQIGKYIQEELHFNAIYGSFETKPIKYIVLH